MKERDLSFDFIKGILIFLVVWGHTIAFTLNEQAAYNPIFIWIYSFHMPLFIFVSGYFAAHSMRMSFKDCLISKAGRLLFPALQWTCFSFLRRVVCDPTLITDFHFSLYGGLIHSLYNCFRGYWFLYCLFVLFLMVNLAWKSKYRYWALLFVFVIYVIARQMRLSMAVPFMEFQIFRQLPLFVLGILCREHSLLPAVPPPYKC